MRRGKTGIAVKIALGVFAVFCLVTVFKLKIELDTLGREYTELQEKVDASEDYIKKLENQLELDAKAYLSDDKTISYNEFMNSLKERSIRSLSKSIKLMYYLCMGASIGGMLWAACEAGFFIFVIKLFVKCFG